jgi:hypothetical protein
MLAHDLRLKGTLAVTGDVERQCAEIAFQRLGTVAVAGIGGVVDDLAALAVPR